MLRSILFGSSSLTATKAPSTATVGHLWGVKHVTPGAVAFVSVLVSSLCSIYSRTTNFYWIYEQAIFLHSVDDTFEANGRKSFIPYKKLFSTYKQIIMTKLQGAQEKDIKFEETITWYNSQVFDWFDLNNKRDGDDLGSSGIDEVMNQMEDMDLNSDKEDDNEDRNAEQTQIHSATAGDSTQVRYYFFLYYGTRY